MLQSSKNDIDASRDLPAGNIAMSHKGAGPWTEILLLLSHANRPPDSNRTARLLVTVLKTTQG